MIYYTIYVKNLSNGTGYIDVALPDDKLMKDYLQFLDLGLRPHHSYPMAQPAGSREGAGTFAINMSDIMAITTIMSPPKRP